jgi:glutamine amidotransferase
VGNRVVIIDYGVGNLYSVRRAVEVSGGGDICVSAAAADIASADRVILPGVGAFADGMRGLRQRGLVEPLFATARAGKPLLGICLGMQMLATTSEEFGTHAGLDLIPGEVKAIPRVSTEGAPLKVPFIGWARVDIASAQSGNGGCLHELGGRAVYLVHSFAVVPLDPANLLASYGYGGNRITAAIRKNNITGVQFHPEKSGDSGLSVLSLFLRQ